MLRKILKLVGVTACIAYIKTAYRYRLDTALHQAVRQSQLATVEKLLAAGANVNTKDKNGKTLLHVAATNGDLAVVLALLDKLPKGTDYNPKNNDGDTPLYWAAIRGDCAIVQAFLDKLPKGADCNPKNNDGDTPLHQTAERGHLTVAQAILDKLPAGADCNPKNNDGNTPLHKASEHGHLTVAQAILDKLPAGADCNPKNNVGNTPLHRAAERGHLMIVQAIWDKLPEGADYNPKGILDSTPLHGAASNRNLALVQAILDKFPAGADCNPKDKTGYTPLHAAAAAVFLGEMTIVQAILDKLSKDEDCNPKNDTGHTPLHQAASHGKLAIVRAILSKSPNADCNPKDNNGRTPLLRAAQFGHLEIVYDLLARPNVILNTPNSDNEVLLHFFSAVPQLSIRKQLRCRGALEWRPTQNAAAGLLAANNSHSIHDPLTEIAVDASIAKLSEGKTPQQIESGYKAFVDYIGSSAFENDITEISQKPFGEGTIGEYTKAATTTPAKRKTLLMNAIRGKEDNPGYVARMMHPNNSSATNVKFKKVASLVWLATQETEHLVAIQALGAEGKTSTHAEIDKELKVIRHNLWKRLLSIQYEYLARGASVEMNHPSCAPGTVNHHLAILNEVHDQVRVSNQPIAQPFNPDSTLKTQLVAEGYTRLIDIIIRAFEYHETKKATLQSIIEVLGVEKCSAEHYDSFLANTNAAPRTEALQLAFEKFIGAVKGIFEPRETEAYIQLEDALREFPYDQLMNVLVTLNKRLNPSATLIVVERIVPTGSKEKAIAILHAYVEEQLSRAARLGPEGALRKAELELKKQALPAVVGVAPEGVAVVHLEELLREEDNKASELVNDAIFDDFREEPALKDFLQKIEMVSRPVSPVGSVRTAVLLETNVPEEAVLDARHVLV